jgi:hypothetical protein
LRLSICGLNITVNEKKKYWEIYGWNYMGLSDVTRHGDISGGCPRPLELVGRMRRVVTPCIYCSWKRSDLSREGYARVDITAVFLF